MMLDAFTGIVAVGILCTCFSAAMLLLWRLLFHRQALLLWGIGIACFATAAFLIVLRPVLPVFVTITLQNQIFLLGYCFLWWGVSTHRNLPPRTVPMLIMSFSFLLLIAWFTYVNPLISMRTIILQSYGVIFLACIIRTLISSSAGLKPMEKVTVAALLLDMGMLIVTVAAQLAYLDYNEPVFRNYISAAYSIAGLITVTSFGLSFFLIVLEQMSNDAHRAGADSRSAKELLETIIDNIPSFVYLKDRDGRLLACNQRLANLIGLSREQAIGKDSHDFFAADIADRQLAEEQTVIRTGAVVTSEECIQASDGLHYYESIKLPVRGEDGQVTSLCGISTDITGRKLAEQELNETRDRFMKLMETVPALAVQGYELDGTVFFWNKASETLYGYSAAEALGANLLDLIIPAEMREEVRQAVQHMKETSIPVPSGELTLVRKDGSPVTVYSSHALIQTGENQPMLFCLDIDLSDRKRMEEKLRRASNEWRRTFDTIPDMITIIDNNHRILRSNRATWQRLGGTMQEIDSQPCYTKFHGLNSPPDYCPHVQLMLDKQPHSSEVFEPRLNAWLDVTVTPLFDDEGKVTGSIHVAHDITELKEAEKVLRVSEEKFRLLFEMSNDAILITVPDGNILAVNPESCRMFGMTADELIQVGREKIIDPSDNRYRPALETRARTGEFKGELNFVRKNGEVFPADVSSSIFKDSSGNTRATVRIEDISERKLVEKELKHKNAEIEQFIYTVSHDLRSPLITIKAFLGYLGRDISTGDHERIDKDLDFMHNAADRMEALLNELLDMSRIGRAVESREQMTFQELVAEAQSAVTGQITTGKVDIRVSPANPILYGDRRRLLQIWQNLLDNALKYMGDQRAPRVEITVEQQGEETVFCVCDNGIGIAPDYHEKIFGIFEKLDSTAGGVGMGLTMVRRIVENCGGRIWVESKGVGSGSCFHFTLPKVVAAAPVSSD